MRLLNFLKKYICRQHSSYYPNILNDFHHGYVELEFSDSIYMTLKKRIRENLYRISNRKTKRSLLDNDENFLKELTFINRLVFKILISKIKGMFELREILRNYDLNSTEIISTLAKKDQIDNTLVRLKGCKSNAEELYLIIPMNVSNSQTKTISFDIISRKFCDLNCVLIDKKYEYDSKSIAVDFPDADFISNSVLVNYVPVQYKLSLSFNHHGGVIFNPHMVYHGFCNLLVNREEFFYLKIQFRKKLSHGHQLKIPESNCGLQRVKIFLGDIKTAE